MCDILLSPKLIYRNRVRKMLKYIFIKQLFLVVASTGYGKTFIIRRFLKSFKNLNYIWFSVDKVESDLETIWNRFCTSAESLNSNLDYKISDFGVPDTDIYLEYFIEFLEQNVKSDTVIIIDNFQNIKNRWAEHIIEKIVCANIQNLHIVIISQTYPNIEYDRLVIDGCCSILKQQDIAFNLDEVHKFFDVNGVHLDRCDLELIYKYTEGWGIGVYTYLMYLKENIDNAYNVVKILVYDKLGEDIKHTLVLVSLLDEFSLEQICYITENNKSISHIKILCDNNYFIQYNSNKYKIHMMLRVVLYDLFLCLPDNYKNNIYKRCGDWFLNDKQYILAIKFYYRAKEYDKILNIIDTNLYYYIFIDDPDTILNVFENISLDLKLNHPLSYLLFIQFYISNIDKNIGKAMLYSIKDFFESLTNAENVKILAEIALIDRVANFDDIYAMDRYLNKAYMLFNGSKSKIYNSNAVFNFSAPFNLIIFHTKLGKLIEIVKSVEQNFWKYNEITNNLACGYEYLIKAEYYYETGNYEYVEDLAYKARFKSMVHYQPTIAMSASFSLICIYFLNGDVESLKSCLEELKYIINVKKFLNIEYDIIIGYIYSTLGEIEKIPKWILNCEYTAKKYISAQNLENACIVYNKYLISKEDFKNLKKASNILLDISLKDNHIIGIILSKIFRAVAEYKLFGIEKSKPILEEAIELAKPDNIISVFTHGSKYMIEIISCIDDEYSKKILDVCKSFDLGISKIKESYLIYSLSDRERSIIELLAKGYKNEDIAKHFSVASVTVEKALSNIYKKLKVKNRVAAVSAIKKL